MHVTKQKQMVRVAAGLLTMGVSIVGYAGNILNPSMATSVSGSTPLNVCCNTGGGGGPTQPPTPTPTQPPCVPCGSCPCDFSDSAPGGTSGSISLGTSSSSGVGNGVPDHNTYTLSIVDNLSFNHIHQAWDYRIGGKPKGCVSCGGETPTIPPQLMTLGLMRIHRYRDVSRESSFGPGVFCNFDTKLYLATLTNGTTVSTVIDLFDPQLLNIQRFIDGPYPHPFNPNDPKDGHYISFKTKSHRDLTLFDAQGLVTSNQSAAATATLTAWSGQKFVFQIVTINGVRVGRMTQIADRNGFGIAITYKYQPGDDLGGSEARLWQMDTATDPYGVQAKFTYNPLQVAGRWVVSQIAVGSGTPIAYAYADGFLSGVQFPDGTQTTLARTYDATSRCTILRYRDAAAEGTHRNKDVYLTSLFGNMPDLPDDIFPQGGQLLRMALNGAGELAYLNIEHPNYTIGYVYEGGGVLKQVYCGWQTAYATAWSIPFNASGVYSYNSVWAQFEPTYNYCNIPGDNGYQKWYSWEPNYKTDETGLRTTYVYTPNGRVSRIGYPDGSAQTFAYNQFLQVTQYVDRLNRKTITQYDSRGNLLSITKAAGTPDQSTESWAYTLDANGIPVAGVPSSHTDANGNVTTYQFDARNRLVKIIQPPDVPNGPRGETAYLWDDLNRIVQVTDPVGRIVQYTYDSRSRVTSVIYFKYPGHATEEYVYGATTADANLVVQNKDCNNNLTQYFYDNAGRKIVEVTGLPGPGSLNPAHPIYQGWTYLDGTDKIASHRRNASYLNPAAPATQWTGGNLTTYAYDYRGRSVSQTTWTSAGKALTSQTIYQNNLVAATVDPYGRATRYVFDVNARPIRTLREAIPGALNGATLATLTRDLSPNARYTIEETAYDAEGQIVARTDPRGIRSSYAFDAQGRLAREIQADQILTNGAFVVAAEGAQTLYRYDPQGNRTNIVHPRTFDRAANGTFTDRANDDFITAFTYNGRNLLASKTEAAGVDPSGAPRAEKATESYTYYLDARSQNRTDAEGNVWTTKWRKCCPVIVGQLDPADLVDDSGVPQAALTISGTDYANQPTYRAVVKKLPTTVTQPWWRNPTDADTLTETTIKYDAAKRKISQTVWLQPLAIENAWFGTEGGDPGTPANYLKTTWTYDDNLTDGAGLDAAYATELATLGAGFFGPNANGSAVETTDPEGDRTLTVFDGTGRTVLTVDASRHVVKYVYDNVVTDTMGAVVESRSIRDPAGLAITTISRTDGLGRRVSSIDGEGKTSTFAFDAAGNLLSTRDPNGVGFDSIFDAQNRELERRDTLAAADGGPVRVSKQAYDAQGNAVTRWDALNNASVSVFDARNRQTQSIDRNTGITAYAYDKNNHMTRLTDPDGSITRWIYNPRGLLAAKIMPLGQFPDADANSDGYPDARTLVYKYDAAHRLTSRLDQTLQLTGYSYDMATRLMQTSYPDGLNDSFNYDGDSRQIQSLSARYGVQVDKTYLPNGQLASETTTWNNESKSVAYAYDNANRQTSVTYPDGKQVARAFNGRDQLAAVSFDGSPVAAYTLDNGGRISNIAFANGAQESRQYRGDNTLRAMAAQTADNQSITALQYIQDANKRRTAEVDGLNSLLSNNYRYDKQDQLTGWNRNDGKSGAWNLSLGGDWNSVTYDGLTETRTHDAAHELLSRNAQALTYDPRGNLLTDNQGRVYAWDMENRLQSITPATPTDGSQRADFIYDTQWRRVAKVVSSWQTDHWVSGITRFTYDGWNLVKASAISNVQSQIQTNDSWFVWGTDLSGTLQGAGGIGGLLSANLNGTTAFYHYQANGNVMALTDSGGAVAARYAYNPYGTLTTQSGALAAVNPFRFSTKFTDDETGLLYYGCRYLSPSLWRWVNRDPLEDYASFGARDLREKLIPHMMDVAMFGLKQGLDNRATLSLRLDALAKTVFWLKGIRSLESGDPMFDPRSYDPTGRNWPDPTRIINLGGRLFLPYGFCANNPINDHDSDGRISLFEVAVVAAIIGGVIYYSYKIKKQADQTPDDEMLGPKGAKCLKDGAKTFLTEVSPDPIFGQADDQGVISGQVTKSFWEKYWDKAFSF